MSATAKSALTVFAREGLALIFIAAGISQITYYQEIAIYVAAYGMGHLFLLAVIVLEISAGLALAFGVYTRLAAAGLAAYALLDITIFMLPPATTGSVLLVMAQMALAAGLIHFALHGGGRISLDDFLAREGLGVQAALTALCSKRQGRKGLSVADRPKARVLFCRKSKSISHQRRELGWRRKEAIEQ